MVNLRRPDVLCACGLTTTLLGDALWLLGDPGNAICHVFCTCSDAITGEMTEVWDVTVRGSHLPGCSTLFDQRQLHPDMERWYLDALRSGLSPRQVMELFEKYAWPVRDHT